MKYLTLLFFMVSLAITAQRTSISGKISDKIGIVINAHVFNKTSKQGTFSNDNGLFTIPVSVGDILEISSIQHHTKTITIANITLKNKILDIKILLQQHVLDEIEIKKTLLTSILSIDINATPKDIGIEKSKNALDFSMINFKKRVILPEKGGKDIGDIAAQSTDPTMSAEWATLASFSIFTVKKEKQLTQRIKRQMLKEELPYKLIRLIGKKNLIENFHIPEDKVFLFISNCIDENLEKYISQNNEIKIIEHIKEKSINYSKDSIH